MPDKKAARPPATPEDEALQQRVEMIMGEKNADGVTPALTGHKSDNPPAIDIFNDPKTAPAVSPTLLKQIGAEPADKVSSAVEPEASTVETATEADVDPANLDDADTDKAVDDIVVNESDTVLAAEDAASDTTIPKVASKRHRLPKFLRNKWLWIGLGVVLVTIFAVPVTRYKLLGLFIKESVSITVSDSKTHRSISGAVVSLRGLSVKSDAGGKATLKVPVGSATLSITKQYYKGYTASYAVGLKSGQIRSVQLVATGRQVPITVLDRVSGKPIAGAQISVLDTTAKTDKKGQAIIVLPTTTATDAAIISLSGYNSQKVTVQVTDQVVAGNSFSLTPAGKIYFLSNLSGKIDVVKADLDGTNRETVLAGTGKEDPNTTSLLASRDWQYLVLKAQRDTAQPSLYLINTSTDKVTNFDTGNADFTLVGWYGHAFIYDVVRNTTSAWQNGHEAVKSYNADNNQLSLLDQNQAEGTATSYAYQGFYNFYILNGLISYNTQWYTYNAGGTSYDLTNKTDTIRGIQPSGQGKKDYQAFAAPGIGYIQAALFEPQGIYYAAYNYSTNQTTYYKFESQVVTTTTSLNQATFNQTYPTYLVSPSGSQTFWSQPRDGKNSLLIGDDNAASQKTIASLSDYAAYGWYSDSYLLVSKHSSELYILPVTTTTTGVAQPALKITDYYKPAQTYAGYGYGYGGL